MEIAIAATASVVAVLTFGIGSSSQDDGGGAISRSSSVQHAVADDSDRIRCKRVKVTGSHMRATVCKTEAQWRAEDSPRVPDPRDSMYRDPSAPR